MDTRRGRSRMQSTARTRRAQVAVVGAGPVGLAVASRLAAHGTRVLVIEAGGDHLAHDDDVATTSGHPLPHPIAETRARGVGGTSSMWISHVFRCRPLDPMDFEPRTDGLHHGWPIDAEEVDAYLADANCIFGLDTATYEPSVLHPGEQPVSSDVLRTGMFRLGDLARFRRFVDRTIGHPNVTLITDTEVLGVRQASDGRVTGVRVAQDGIKGDIECDDVVLAAGGLENARLLLLSDDCDPDGIGNAAGLVGRGFMEHPHTELGHLRPSDGAALSMFDRRESHLGGTEGYLTFTPETLIEHHLPQAVVWLHPISMRQSVADISADVAGLRSTPRASGRELAGSIRRLGSTVADRMLHPDGRSFQRLVSCELEQFPTSDSAVTLGEERDSFGRRNLHLHWSLGREFDRIHDRLVSVLAPAFEQLGLGELVPFAPLDRRRSIGIGNHHMGTTRMGSTRDDGVVDVDCKVYDTEGVFVVGTSVFTTAGAANPTLSAVALGLRLGDHLSARCPDLHRPPVGAMCEQGDDREPVPLRPVAARSPDDTRATDG